MPGAKQQKTLHDVIAIILSSVLMLILVVAWPRTKSHFVDEVDVRIDGLQEMAQTGVVSGKLSSANIPLQDVPDHMWCAMPSDAADAEVAAAADFAAACKKDRGFLNRLLDEDEPEDIAEMVRDAAARRGSPSKRRKQLRYCIMSILGRVNLHLKSVPSLMRLYEALAPHCCGAFIMNLPPRSRFKEMPRYELCHDTVRAILPLSVGLEPKSCGVWSEGNLRYFENDWLVVDASRNRGVFNRQRMTPLLVLCLMLERPEERPPAVDIPHMTADFRAQLLHNMVPPS